MPSGTFSANVELPLGHEIAGFVEKADGDEHLATHLLPVFVEPFELRAQAHAFLGRTGRQSDIKHNISREPSETEFLAGPPGKCSSVDLNFTNDRSRGVQRFASG